MFYFHKILIILLFSSANLFAQVKAPDYYNIGKDDFLTGNYELGLKNFLRIKKSSLSKDINYFIGMSYFNLHKQDSAIIYFDKDLIENPTNYNSFIKKAQCEKYLKNYKGALKDLDKLIELNSAYLMAYYEKAEILFELHSYDKAIELYNKVLEQKPHFENSFYKIGFCYLNLKDTSKACESWKQLEDPDDFEEYQKIDRICKTKP